MRIEVGRSVILLSTYLHVFIVFRCASGIFHGCFFNFILELSSVLSTYQIYAYMICEISNSEHRDAAGYQALVLQAD